ncbi:hypothetical protein HYW20_07315 [Candidatus Woesearchaeota archaeon]|nr:hypothetical protein [Candidatus Woesearchaeota archaeon]
MGFYAFQLTEKSKNPSSYRHPASKLLRLNDTFPQALKLLADKKVYAKISEEYTLQEALFIQNRLDRGELKLHEMMSLGKFIIGERSGKLYLVDKGIEAIIGRERLTADEFFDTDRRNEFLHMQYRDIFTYVIQKPKSITPQDLEGVFVNVFEPDPRLRSMYPPSKTQH